MPLTLSELIEQRLLPTLGYLQTVEMFNHLGRQISATQIKFPYDKWVDSVTPIFRKNNEFATPDSTDTDTGIITVNSYVTGDDWTVEGQFSYFSDTELETFYHLAMSHLNANPPTSNFSFSGYPDHAVDYLTMYARKLALERILTDLMSWRARLIWTDPAQLASVLQAQISGIESYLSQIILNIKGRGFLTPHSISAAKFSNLATVTDFNWQNFTVLGTGQGNG